MDQSTMVKFNIITRHIERLQLRCSVFKCATSEDEFDK